MAVKLLRSFGKELIRTPLVRYAHYLSGKPLEEALSLSQILAARNEGDPEVDYKVDIGFKMKKLPSIRELLKSMPLNDRTLEHQARTNTLNIPINDVAETWKKTLGPAHIRMIADHYGIYDDLFGDAYFYPCVPLDINFSSDTNLLLPVCRGNIVKPSEASKTPTVYYEASPDTLWTLILSNPDGHFTKNDSEYVHWFIGNISGNDLNKGDVVWDYLQPFPARGTGYQRFIFVLYKQDKRIDYSQLKQDLPCLELEKRTFRTEDFYRLHEDNLTPAGLAFFQSDWDPSLTDFFHKVLQMKEPVFEYDFPQRVLSPPQKFPKKKAFNTYLDMYRDPKEIAKEYVLEKLKNHHPFQKPSPPLKFPNAHRFDHDTPSWLIDKLRRDRLRWGRINDY